MKTFKVNDNLSTYEINGDFYVTIKDFNNMMSDKSHLINEQIRSVRHYQSILAKINSYLDRHPEIPIEVAINIKNIMSEKEEEE